MKKSHQVQLSVTTSFEEAFSSEVCLELIQTFRVLEGRREVWLAKVAGGTQRVIAKKFLPGSKQAKESQREIRGLQQLAERRIRSPRLLCTAQDDALGLWVVTEYIEDSCELSDLILHCMDPDIRRSVIREFFAVLLQHWQAGVHQTDAHLRNFLWDGQSIYTIDVGLIRFKNAPLTAANKAAVLAEMLGGFTVSFREEFLSLIPSICDEFNERVLLGRIQSEQFRRRMAQEEAQNLKRIWRKSQRDCSQYLATNQGRSQLICQRALDPALIEKLKNAPEELMSLGTRLKSGNTCTVQRIEWQGRPMVLKRYNPKPIFYRIRHRFHMSRAMRSWCTGVVMSQLNIPTTMPLAVVEETKCGLLERGYFLMDHFDGESVDAYLNRHEVNGPTFNFAVSELERLFRRMKQLRIIHGDFKAKNILINDTGIRLIDTDGMRFLVGRRKFAASFRADFTRFLNNWPEGAEVRAILKQRLSDIFS